MQVYYFTRTNRSKDIAEELASKYNTKASKIEDGISWKGPINFIKGGYMSSTKKSVEITYDKPVADEPVVLIFPVWADTFPPAVKSFIDQVGRENIIAVPTSMGSKLKTRDGFIKVCDLVGKQIVAPSDI